MRAQCRSPPGWSVRGAAWSPMLKLSLFLVPAGAAAVALAAFALSPARPDPDVARPAVACSSCPVRTARVDELAVAGQAGSHLVAAWMRRASRGVAGEIRVTDVRGRPSDGFQVQAPRIASCGRGCRRFARPGFAPLRVSVREAGRRYVVALPTRWKPRGSSWARRLLVRAEAAMRRLRSVREEEVVTSVPGVSSITRFRLQAPDRLAYRTFSSRAGSRGARPVFQTETIVVGRSRWSRAPGQPWRRGPYGNGLPFRTHSWFRWTPYAATVRLLGVSRRAAHPVARIALMDPAVPSWWQLWIDVRTPRVTEVRQISPGQSSLQRYSAFGAPHDVRAPRDPSR